MANPNLMTLKGHESIVNYCCYSPNTDATGADGLKSSAGVSSGSSKVRIVSAADEGTLKVYDAKSGEEMMTLKGHTNWCVFLLLLLIVVLHIHFLTPLCSCTRVLIV